MNNFPTLLGQEPRFTGIIPGRRPIIPPEVVGIPHNLHYRIILTEEKIYRFPLVVRLESIRRMNKRGGRGNIWHYRWMLYTIPFNSDLDQIETELESLNTLRKERGEYPFPILASDISSNRWDGHSHLGGENVSLVSAFVRAFRPFSE